MSDTTLAVATVDASIDDVPYVLSFPAIADRMRSQSIVERARLERHNQRCRHCGRVTVETVELDDALLDRRGMPIPGTATVVGFFCNACRHDWPVNHLKLAGDLED
jgi:hypothetical protein